jgi:predicted transcriptional regulator
MLGPLQQAVMNIFWEVEEATVHDVLERLSSTKPLAYTSVLSCLQKLEKLGWLTHRAEQRTYYYRAARTREEVGRRSLTQLLDGVFGGSRTRLFEQLLEDDRSSPEDLAELQRLIERKRQEGEGRDGRD